jgi:hypothetical protein
LGRDRQRFDFNVVQTADPGVAEIGADGLRVRTAGPEWMEPVSSFSIRLDCGFDRPAVHNLWIRDRALSKELGPR